MQSAPPTRECPSCEARCPGTAQICYRCKKVLPQIAAFSFEDDEIDAVRAAVAESRVPPALARREQPGRFRRGTWIAGAICVAGLVTSMFGGDAIGPGMIVFFCALVVFLAMFIGDLIAPSARGRKTPELAVRCYFKSLARRRWASAHACLSPLTHERRVHVPALAALRSVPQELALTDPAQLERYWKTLASSVLPMSRRLTNLRIRRLGGDGVVDRYLVQLRLSAYPTGYLFLGVIVAIMLEKHVDTSFEVLVHPAAGQYWVYGGELGHRAVA